MFLQLTKRLGDGCEVFAEYILVDLAVESDCKAALQLDLVEFLH